MSRLTVVMLGSLVTGLVAMVGFEATLTRVLGVALLFAFIVAGVFVIADPDFLERDDE